MSQADLGQGLLACGTATTICAKTDCVLSNVQEAAERPIKCRSSRQIKHTAVVKQSSAVVTYLIKAYWPLTPSGNLFSMTMASSYDVGSGPGSMLVMRMALCLTLQHTQQDCS